MKRLMKYLDDHKSHYKSGSERLAVLTGISINTIDKYKRSKDYKEKKRKYRSALSKG